MGCLLSRTAAGAGIVDTSVDCAPVGQWQGEEGQVLQRMEFAWKSNRPLTREQLELEQFAFWDTCYSYGVSG